MATHNPFMIIKAAVRSMFSKNTLSPINIANMANIGVIVFMTQLSENPTPMGLSLFVTGLVTIVLNKFYPEKMLINSGLKLDVVLYLLGFAGVLMGCTEMMSSEMVPATMKISEMVASKWHMWIPIIYSVVMIYIRTGYTNQVK